MNQRKSRELWIDFAKGLGIFLVVLGHTNRGIYNAGIPLDVAFFKLSDSLIYSFHMPLFFYLSGCFFKASFERHGQLGLIRDKLATLVYPYLIWSILQGCIEVALSQITNGNASWRDIASILWQPRAQFWFLYVLFLLFVVFSLIRGLFTQMTSPFLTPIALALSIALACSQTQSDFVFPLNFIATYALFFYLGSEKNWIEKIPNNLSTVALCTVAFFAAEYYWHVDLNLRYTDKSPWLLLITSLGVLWTLVLCRYLAERVATQFAWLGHLGFYSMPIFLAHIIAASGMRIILAKFLHIQNVYVHWSVGMLAGLFLPILLYRIAQRITVFKYLFNSPWR